MDPASAVIGIVSFSCTVFGKINEMRKAIKTAPDDLQSLEDSCFLAELSLEQIRAMGIPESSRVDAARLERLCNNVQRQLEDVDVIMEKVTVAAAVQGNRARERSIRRVKWLMKKDDLDSIARKLKELQMTLALMVIMMQSISQTRSSRFGTPERVSTPSHCSAAGAQHTNFSFLARNTLRCPPNCACRCHYPSVVQLIPSWLEPYVGRVAISRRLLHPAFSSWSICNEQTCRGDLRRTVTLQWTSWLVHGYLQYVSKDCRIHFSIGAPRVISWDSPIINAVFHGNLQGARSLFTTGQASIWDHAVKGVSVFRYACQCWQNDPSEEHLKVISLFVEAGAEALLFEETPMFYSAHDILALGLFKYLLDKTSVESKSLAAIVRTNAAAVSIFRSLLNMDAMDALEDYLYRYRSKRTDISVLLASLSDKECNSVNLLSVFEITGYTPLEYAAQVSPRDILPLLADGEDATKGPLLAYATGNGMSSLMKPLLDAGADVNMKDCWGHTALLDACSLCCYQDFAELYRWAEDAIDWNVCAPDGRNALDLFESGVLGGMASDLSQSQIDDFRAVLVAHVHSVEDETDGGHLDMPGSFPDAK